MNLLIQLCLKYYTGTYKVPTLRLLKTPELISVRRLPCRFKLEIDLSEKSPPVGSCVNLLPLRSLEVPKEVNYFNDMFALWEVSSRRLCSISYASVLQEWADFVRGYNKIRIHPYLCKTSLRLKSFNFGPNYLSDSLLLFYVKCRFFFLKKKFSNSFEMTTLNLMQTVRTT